jgi:hypothetical protein
MQPALVVFLTVFLCLSNSASGQTFPLRFLNAEPNRYNETLTISISFATSSFTCGSSYGSPCTLSNTMPAHPSDVNITVVSSAGGAPLFDRMGTKMTLDVGQTFYWGPLNGTVGMASVPDTSPTVGSVSTVFANMECDIFDVTSGDTIYALDLPVGTFGPPLGDLPPGVTNLHWTLRPRNQPATTVHANTPNLAPGGAYLVAFMGPCSSTSTTPPAGMLVYQTGSTNQQPPTAPPTTPSGTTAPPGPLGLSWIIWGCIIGGASAALLIVLALVLYLNCRSGPNRSQYEILRA